MFKIVFSKLYDNVIFTKHGLKPVVEDYFKTNDNIFCVADGVTRDDINGNPVGYPNSEQEAINWVKNYPNPSGAYESAKIICESFVENVSKLKENEVSKQSIEYSIKKANKDLKAINSNRIIDYLKEDLYCCEAVGGIIIGNKLYCFSIGDCHITVLDNNFDTIFTTINNHLQFEEYLNNVYIKENEFDWNNPKMRQMVRKEYRNNPNKKYEGKDISYGALSGEENAEYYIDTYVVDLTNAKYVCAYSDGCEPFFENKEQIKKLLTNLDSLKDEGKERTLIVYEDKK